MENSCGVSSERRGTTAVRPSTGMAGERDVGWRRNVAGVRNLTQVEAAERARLLDVTGVRHHPGPHRRRRRARRGHASGRSTEVRVHLHRARRRARSSRSPPTAIRVGDAQRRAGRHLRLVGREGPDPDRAGRRQHAGGRRRLPLLRHRPGPAPQRRPGRQGGLPLQPVRDRRRPAGLRLLRPARPQGRLHLARHRARRTGRSSPTCRSSASRTPATARRQDRPLRPVGADEHLRHRAVRRAVPRGARQPRRHRPGRVLPRSRWRSTSTPTTSS